MNYHHFYTFEYQHLNFTSETQFISCFVFIFLLYQWLWGKKKLFKNILLSTYGEIDHILQNTNINKNNKVLVRKNKTREEGKSQKNWTE